MWVIYKAWPSAQVGTDPVREGSRDGFFSPKIVYSPSSGTREKTHVAIFPSPVDSANLTVAEQCWWILGKANKESGTSAFPSSYTPPTPLAAPPILAGEVIEQNWSLF